MARQSAFSPPRLSPPEIQSTMQMLPPLKLWAIGRFNRNAQLFLVLAVIQGIVFGIYLLFLNLFILARGFDKDFLGLLTAIPAFVGLVFAFPSGALSDRFGRRSAMIWGTLLSSLALVGVILLTNKAGLCAVAALSGCGRTLVMVSSAPFLAENSTAEERTSLFSTHFGLRTLAGFVGNLVGGFLPTLFAHLLAAEAESVTSYQGVLWTVFALNLAALIPLSRMREAERKKPASPEPGPNPSTGIPFGLVGKLLLPNAIISIGAGLLIPYLNVFFKEKFAIPDAALGTVFSISSIMTGVATLSAPLLARRMGHVRAIVFSQLASIPFLLTLGFSPWLGVAVTAFWVRAALMNMGNPLYSAFAMEQVDEASRARVSSLLGMGWNIGWSVGPYLSGLMQMRVGFGPIFLVTTAAYVIGAATVHLLFARTDARPGIREPE